MYNFKIRQGINKRVKVRELMRVRVQVKVDRCVFGLYMSHTQYLLY